MVRKMPRVRLLFVLGSELVLDLRRRQEESKQQPVGRVTVESSGYLDEEKEAWLLDWKLIPEMCFYFVIILTLSRSFIDILVYWFIHIIFILSFSALHLGILCNLWGQL